MKVLLIINFIVTIFISSYLKIERMEHIVVLFIFLIILYYVVTSTIFSIIDSKNDADAENFKNKVDVEHYFLTKNKTIKLMESDKPSFLKGLSILFPKNTIDELDNFVTNSSLEEVMTQVASAIKSDTQSGTKQCEE
jgi:hypothetical protein